MDTIRILYFARLREAFRMDGETLEWPQTGSVDALVAQLRARGGVWSEELAPGKVFRVAVDQDMARGDTPVRPGCEVAVFPPVTGG